MACPSGGIAIESGERSLGRPVDDAQQRPGGPVRRALALLPIAHRITGTPIRLAKATCDRPILRRTRRA